jgi:uncharacterized protein involved in high-affinity Fe2+ transport
MKKLIIALFMILYSAAVMAVETPLCLLPQAKPDFKNENPNPGCNAILKNAQKFAETVKSPISWVNTTSIPSPLSVGAVYLQPITMAPAGMMLPREQSDIHLELDIHAKDNLKARGFAPGDWLPNAEVDYTIQKVGAQTPLITHVKLMPMVASDGAHYGDNVKLAGPGFYIVTFEAHTNPHFGWHVDADSKILGTEYVNWRFTQSYLMKWTGVGKLGGY